MVKDHSDSEKGNPLPPHTVSRMDASPSEKLFYILHTSLHDTKPDIPARHSRGRARTRETPAGVWLWQTRISHSGCGTGDLPAATPSQSEPQTYTHKQGRKETVYLTTHSTHFIYGYMESNIW